MVFPRTRAQVFFAQRVLRPWLKRTMQESKRVAELLAHLPPELNVEALVLEAMGGDGAELAARRAAAVAKGGKRVGAGGVTPRAPGTASSFTRKGSMTRSKRRSSGVGSHASSGVSGSGVRSA